MSQAKVIAAATITAQVDQATLALVDKVAKAQGRDPSDFIAEAIRRVAESEADFLEFVQAGIDDLEAGRTHTHEEVMAELETMIARQRER